MSRLDRLVEAGVYANRTEAVRAALEILIEEAERRDLESAIIAGYEKSPDDIGDDWLSAATKALVAAEPW